jgi:hypothetical protein
MEPDPVQNSSPEVLEFEKNAIKWNRKVQILEEID